MKALRDATATYDLALLAEALREAVPEFNPASETEPLRDTTVVAFPARRSRQH